MPHTPAAITLPTGRSYFRCTSLALQGMGAAILNGRGAFKRKANNRYNRTAQVTVYIAESLEASLAEYVFYSHRSMVAQFNHANVLPGLVSLQMPPAILWEFAFANSVANVFDLCQPPNCATFQVIRALLLNPTHDYSHLQNCRDDIQVAPAAYEGLRAPSARCPRGGNMVVLFNGQDKNVAAITPYLFDMRLITQGGTPFQTPLDDLDYGAVEIRFTSPLPLPPHLAAYAAWTKFPFNH